MYTSQVSYFASIGIIMDFVLTFIVFIQTWVMMEKGMRFPFPLPTLMYQTPSSTSRNFTYISPCSVDHSLTFDRNLYFVRRVSHHSLQLYYTYAFCF